MYSMVFMGQCTTASMNAESQWHKSTIGRPDRDGLHPLGLFSNEKKRGREILISRKKKLDQLETVNISIGSFLVEMHISFGFQQIDFPLHV